MLTHFRSGLTKITGSKEVLTLQLLHPAVFQDNGEDSHHISPSPVVHVRGLCEAVVEADLIDALEKFGPIWYTAFVHFRV